MNIKRVYFFTTVNAMHKYTALLRVATQASSIGTTWRMSHVMCSTLLGPDKPLSLGDLSLSSKGPKVAGRSKQAVLPPRNAHSLSKSQVSPLNYRGVHAKTAILFSFKTLSVYGLLFLSQSQVLFVKALKVLSQLAYILKRVV